MWYASLWCQNIWTVSSTQISPPAATVTQSWNLHFKGPLHIYVYITDEFSCTCLNVVLWLTEANFAFGLVFSYNVAWRRQSIQRCSPPLQNGDQTIWGGTLKGRQKQNKWPLMFSSCWRTKFLGSLYPEPDWLLNHPNVFGKYSIWMEKVKVNLWIFRLGLGWVLFKATVGRIEKRADLARKFEWAQLAGPSSSPSPTEEAAVHEQVSNHGNWEATWRTHR